MFEAIISATTDEQYALAKLMIELTSDPPGRPTSRSETTRFLRAVQIQLRLGTRRYCEDWNRVRGPRRGTEEANTLLDDAVALVRAKMQGGEQALRHLLGKRQETPENIREVVRKKLDILPSTRQPRVTILLAIKAEYQRLERRHRGQGAIPPALVMNLAISFID